MTPMLHRGLAAIAVAVLLSSATGTFAQAVDPREAFREAVEEYLRRPQPADGPMVVFKGIGSWVQDDSPGFRNPLGDWKHPSDLDLTMVMPGATPGEAADAWRRAQREIREALEAKLIKQGVSAEKIARLNREYLTIYPPAQIMADVKDVEDANAIFKALGTWPKPDQNVEGLYGEAARAWTQNLEATKGTVFFLDAKSGTLVEGATDLAHLMEGYGRWTLRSTAGLSDQLADKALDAIRQSDAVGALKNLGRLEGALKKARDLGRVPPDAELASLLATADLAPDDPAYAAKAESWLREHRRDVERLLEESRDEARALKELADAWGGRPIPIGRVERLVASARFGPLRTQAAEWARATGRATGSVLRRLLIATGIAALAVEAAGVAAAGTDEGLSPAALEAFRRTVRFLNLPGELVEGVLEEARVGGIGLVTRFQDCEDLVAGVFSVKGRERTGDGYQIAELGRRFARADVVVGIVERKAWQAASRGWTADLSRQSEAVEDALETDIADALASRCVPPIATAWQEERLRLVAQVLAERARLDEVMARTIVALEAGAAPGDTTTLRVVEAFDAPRAGRAIDGMVAALGRVNEAAVSETGGVIRSWRVVTRTVWSVNEVVRDPVVRTTLVLAGDDFDPLAAARDGLTVPTMPPGVTREVALAVTVSVEPAALVGDLYEPRSTLEQAALPMLAQTYQWQATWVPPALTGLEVTGTITNRVTGEPLPGARVVLVGERTHTATADAEGHVAITGLAPGDYRIDIGHVGFVTRTAALSVRRPLRNGTFALTPLERETTTAAREPLAAPPSPEARPVPSAPKPPPLPAGAPASATFPVTFADRHVKNEEKVDAAQRFRFTVPGPGTVTLTYTYRPATPMNRNYKEGGGNRTEAHVWWRAPGGETGTLWAGRLARGSEGPADTTNQTRFTVAGPGEIELVAHGETHPSYFYREQGVDNWYGATHLHYLGATGTVRVEFTPAR